jgi:hypothetical protein
MCVSKRAVAAVVDAESIHGPEFAVVKSLKGVRYNLPIILLEERHGNRDSPLPEGVDAVVAMSSTSALQQD